MNPRRTVSIPELRFPAVTQNIMHDQHNPSAVSRRHFLKNSSLAAAAAAVSFPAILHAQIKPPLNAVIIGVGGRGAGAGRDFLEAAKVVGVEARIVAAADIFPEQARRANAIFAVAENRSFSGFDAYQKALSVPGVNYAILATPPGFRPAHFKACVESGKHVFMEKPVAVDGPGCRIMYAAGQEARRRNLKVAAGTQRRHSRNYTETIQRIQDGAIGDITALRAYWVAGGPIWHRGTNGRSELEQQIRNWYHYIWLCGDHCVEQHVHNIDVCNWAMGNQHPIKAWGMGARQQLGDKPGEIWDNFSVEYQYENGVRLHSYCGQIKRGWSSVSEAAVGSGGTAEMLGNRKLFLIRPNSGRPWRSEIKNDSGYLNEHVNLINAILNDTELNETQTVTDSTLTAIMGREAAYSGGAVEWEAVLHSRFAYGPELLFQDCARMQWGSFRTLASPLPTQHDIFKDPPVVAIAKA
jgi:myo-inositol 2-dehydrogenase / D-chiro-inositol 1-dehydrogenase